MSEDTKINQLQFSHQSIWNRLILIVNFIWLILNISICLAANSISGTVRNEDGQALYGVRVQAIVYGGPYQYFAVLTDENGNYSFDNLSVGKYILRTYNQLGYMDEFYDNVYEEQEASILKLIKNTKVKDINFVLNQKGGHIRGKIMVRKLQTPIEGVGVIFINKHTLTDFLTYSEANGHFKSPALPIGNYFVLAYGSPKGYISEYYNNKNYLEEADTVNVDLSNKAFINFELDKGSVITGKVYEAETLDPITDARVVIYTPEGQWHADTRTKLDGSYILGGIPEGQFYARVRGIDPWSYFAEYYNNVSNIEDATLIKVTHGDTTFGIDFYIEQVTTQEISNEYISIAVTDKYIGSNLSIANTGGLPDSEEDDHAKLLSDFPHPTMSYTSIWFDGKVLRFGSAQGEHAQNPMVSENKKSITRAWRYNRVNFIQKASLIESEWSLLHYEDTAKLEYVIVNQDVVKHEVGLRILLDTMLGDTDGVPISVLNRPLIFYEQEYFADQMPHWWTAIKCDTTINGDTINVSFSAQGTMREYGATCPDRFIIAKYGNIDRKEYYWNYEIDKNSRITHDSAVALWWYPKSIEPGDTIRIVTYYGLGKGAPDREPPKIIQYLPEKYSTVYPNTPIRIIIADNKTGLDTNSVNIKINNKPARLRFEGPIDSITVHCTLQETFKCNQSVKIDIGALRDYAEPPNERNSESYTFDIVQDTTPPIIVDHKPAHLEYGVDPNTSIRIILKDIPAGVNADSLKLYVKNQPVIQSFDISQRDSLLYLESRPGLPLQMNDTVEVTLEAIDLADPPNRMDSTFIFYTFNEDTIPPCAKLIYPEDSSKNVPPNTQIILNLLDEMSGADTTSIKMWVNDDPVRPHVKLDSTIHNIFLTYNSKRNKLFDFGEVVRVRLWATDLVSNAIDTLQGHFAIFDKTHPDTIPPLLSEHYPTNAQREVPRDTTIWFRIIDDHSGVEKKSVKLWANEKIVQPQKIIGESLNYIFEYRPESNWNYNDSVVVEICAQDLAHSPNIMVPYSFCFYIKTDTIPPCITNISPEPDSQNIPIDVIIKFDIFDGLAGVDLDSLKLIINNGLVDYELEGDSLHYTVSGKPQNQFNYNQTINVKVTAADLSNPPNLVQRSWKFTTKVKPYPGRIDTLPPFVTDLKPQKNTKNNDPNTSISFHIHDYDSGVDPNLIYVTVNEQLPILHIDSVNSRHYHVECELEKGFEFGQLVKVAINAADLAEQKNYMDTLRYVFKIKEYPQRPDLAVIEISTIPDKNIKMNNPFKIKASVQNNQTPIDHSFHVKFYIGEQTLKDTILTSINRYEVKDLFANIQLPKGTYQLKARVDTENDVIEDSETNNEKEIFINIMEGNLIVRPNPFTPNNDGFNDEAIFNFSELSLRQPELRLFTFKGCEILCLSENSEYTFKWNGRDKNGIEMQPGIYLYILKDGKNMVAKGSIVLAR